MSDVALRVAQRQAEQGDPGAAARALVLQCRASGHSMVRRYLGTFALRGVEGRTVIVRANLGTVLCHDVCSRCGLEEAGPLLMVDVREQCRDEGHPSALVSGDIGTILTVYSASCSRCGNHMPGLSESGTREALRSRGFVAGGGLVRDFRDIEVKAWRES